MPGLAVMPPGCGANADSCTGYAWKPNGSRTKTGAYCAAVCSPILFVRCHDDGVQDLTMAYVDPQNLEEKDMALVYIAGKTSEAKAVEKLLTE